MSKKNTEHFFQAKEKKSCKQSKHALCSGQYYWQATPDALHLKQWWGTKRVHLYISNIYDLLLLLLSLREQGLQGREAEADAPNFGDFIYNSDYSKLKRRHLLWIEDSTSNVY
jgi:hypothetical protein